MVAYQEVPVVVVRHSPVGESRHSHPVGDILVVDDRQVVHTVEELLCLQAWDNDVVDVLVVDVHVVVHRGVVHSRVVDNHSHGVVDSHGVDDHAGVDSHRVVAHSRVVVAHIQVVVVHSQAVVAHSHGVEDDHMGQEVDGHMALVVVDVEADGHTLSVDHGVLVGIRHASAPGMIVG